MCGAFAESRRGQTSRFIKTHTMACVGVVVAVVVVHDVFWGVEFLIVEDGVLVLCGVMVLRCWPEKI